MILGWLVNPIYNPVVSKKALAETKIPESGEEGDYTCHHQNNFCIKMGSGVSRFNVSLIVRGKVVRWHP